MNVFSFQEYKIMCNNTQIYHYYQLLNPTFDNLVKGTDNPAGIPDGTHLSSAKKIAKDWMKKNGINNAVLVRNVVTDSTDNIEKIIDLTLQCKK